MSGRHLVRKLGEEGSSFKLLRDGLLQGMAEKQLQKGARLGDIAEALGFSDESAFSKAFKRWTGMTPAQFREKI
ncbi:MAG: helix-turn-helix transcriptional regulator [Alcanivorax nanhaiticus]